MSTRQKAKKAHKSTNFAETDPDFVGYLETLLAEIDYPVDREASPHIKVKSSNAATESQSAQVFGCEKAQIIRQSSQETSIDKHKGTDEYPEWASVPFQVLLFEVCGITLGVPLVSLIGILKTGDSLCKIPGQPIWHLGIISNHSQKVVVVDTSRLIMPEKIASANHRQETQGGYLLLIGRGDFGLLIDEIRNTVRMDKRDIRWRNRPERQPWLAGIITEQLSVLLNVDVLLEMVQRT